MTKRRRGRPEGSRDPRREILLRFIRALLDKGLSDRELREPVNKKAGADYSISNIRKLRREAERMPTEDGNRGPVQRAEAKATAIISAHLTGRLPTGAQLWGFDRIICDKLCRERLRIAYGEKFQCPPGWFPVRVPTKDKKILNAVRWAHQAILDGETVNEIARELNRRDLGRRFNRTAARNLFEPEYAGIQVTGKKSRGRFCRVAEHVDPGDATAKPGLAPLPDAYEGIVSAETHYAVQAILRKNVRTNSGMKSPDGKYLLSYKVKRKGEPRGLVCDHCDHKMIAREWIAPPGSKVKGTFSRYFCDYCHLNGQTFRTVTAKLIEDYIVDLCARSGLLSRTSGRLRDREKMKEELRAHVPEIRIKFKRKRSPAGHERTEYSGQVLFADRPAAEFCDADLRPERRSHRVSAFVDSEYRRTGKPVTGPMISEHLGYRCTSWRSCASGPIREAVADGAIRKDPSARYGYIPARGLPARVT
jgi:hypothetical protein